MLLFNFSSNFIQTPPSDTDELKFDDVNDLLNDLNIIDKRRKVILDDSEPRSANCGNGNDEVMELAEDFTTYQLLIGETEEQENLFFNLANEKANATSANENTKVAPLLGRLPPLNLKKDGDIIANQKLGKRGKAVSARRLALYFFSD